MCPIKLIFSGNIAEGHKFFWIAEISKFNPQLRYFLNNLDIRYFEYGHIWRGDLENQVSRKSISYICIRLTSKPVKSIMPTLQCHFYGKIDHIDRFDSKSKFSINPKISVILKIDIPLRSVNMCQNGNPSRSGVRVGVLDKTTTNFFKNIGLKFFPYI